MKIERISLHGLRNDEHFQLNTELRTLVTKHGAAALKVEAQWASYLPLYDAEDEALKKVMKSALTAGIEEADRRRDQLFRGMVDANKATLNHFKVEVQEAAKRLKILFDSYGNLAKKPLNEETSAIYNLLQDLGGKYSQDAELTGAADWAAELKAANEAYSALVADRYEETAARCNLVLRQCRLALDEAYRTIMERIDALMVVEGTAHYEGFVRLFNAVVAKYAATLAQRQGGKKENS